MNKQFLIKSILIYLIFAIILCKSKPNCFYNNNNLKPWYQYSITNDINDLITFGTCLAFSSIMSLYFASIIT
jgi:hypothetical protein